MNKASQINDKYYRTANFFLAALLFTKDQQIVNVDRTNPKSVEFVFLDTPERELICRDYLFGSIDSDFTRVDVRKFETAFRFLKKLLYESTD